MEMKAERFLDLSEKRESAILHMKWACVQRKNVLINQKMTNRIKEMST